MSSAQIPRRYQNSVFLNFPYDKDFQDLSLAYIVGVCSFGLAPRATLEIVGGEQRLRRIANLIRSCRFSFHDLSRVEVDAPEPATPRFNMPFEAGLAVMWSLIETGPKHTYFIFEKDYRRLNKSLSDLGGTDVYAHGGTPIGVLREVSNALVLARRRPSVDQMLTVFDRVRSGLDDLMTSARAETLYTARVFLDVVAVVNEVVQSQVSPEY